MLEEDENVRMGRAFPTDRKDEIGLAAREGGAWKRARPPNEIHILRFDIGRDAPTQKTFQEDRRPLGAAQNGARQSIVGFLPHQSAPSARK